MPRAGRKQGPVRGETPEANAFALWLRGVTQGWTLERLTDVYPASRTQWGHYRNGAKLPPDSLLQKTVERCVRNTTVRPRHLVEGRRLLQLARKAQRGHGALLTPPPVTDLAARLDDARQAQLEAERALFRMQQLVHTLLRLVASLQDRCQRLEELEEGRSEQELRDSRERLASAERLLEQARRERREAEEIRLDAESNASQRERAVAKARLEHEDSDSATPIEDLPDLWEVDHLLERSSTELDVQRADLAALRERVTPGPVRPSQVLTPDNDLADIDSGSVVNGNNGLASDNVPMAHPMAPGAIISLAESYRRDAARVANILTPLKPPSPPPLRRQGLWRSLGLLAIGLISAAVPIPVAAALGHAYRLEGLTFFSAAYCSTLLVAIIGVGRIMAGLGMRVSGFSDQSASTVANEAVSMLALTALMYGFLFAVAALSSRRMWILSDVGWAVTAWLFT